MFLNVKANVLILLLLLLLIMFLLLIFILTFVSQLGMHVLCLQ